MGMFLAFTVVPQWEEPSVVEGTLSMQRQCSDDPDESLLICLQRQLPVEIRQWIFQRLMKGPFVVAPFVRLVLKVFVPWLVLRVTWRFERSSPCCCSFRRKLFRILALIFVYDWESVGGFRYLSRGEPFTDLAILYAEDTFLSTFTDTH